MVSKNMTIKAPDGLHARPAGDLARLVKSFPGTRVDLATPSRKVNASGVLSILSLGLKKGVEVEVITEGPDEEKALAAVSDFLDSLGE